RAYKSGFKLATVRGPSETESGELRRIGFLSPNIFHVRANFGEVNLAVRGGDKTAVRRRRAIRREIYEVQAVPCESVGVMHVGSAWRVIARLRCPRLINRATVRLNTGDVIIRGFMRRCAGNFLNNLWLVVLASSKPDQLQSTLVNVSHSRRLTVQAQCGEPIDFSDSNYREISCRDLAKSIGRNRLYGIANCLRYLCKRNFPVR
ncbi:hypothetical protein ALC62_10068, partial [Cyphomyrmex costatus]